MKKLHYQGWDFINLTPHSITVQTPLEEITIPLSGKVARVEMTNIKEDRIAGIPVLKKSPGRIINLPDPRPYTLFIVSSVVLQYTTRPDVVAPDTSNAVRDDSGRIVAVPGFVRNPYTTRFCNCGSGYEVLTCPGLWNQDHSEFVTDFCG